MRRLLCILAALLTSALLAREYPVIDQNLSATFRLNGTDKKSGAVFHATGFAVNSRTVVTAGHFGSEKNVEFTLDLFDKDDWHLVRTIAIKLKKTTKDFDKKPAEDMAVFKADEDLPFLAFDDDNAKAFDDAKTGDLLYLVGCPWGSCPYHIQFGLLGDKESGFEKGLANADVLGAPGNSGCGVFDYKSHKLIGMLVRGNLNTIYFVPVNALLEYVKKHK